MGNTSKKVLFFLLLMFVFLVIGYFVGIYFSKSDLENFVSNNHDMAIKYTNGYIEIQAVPDLGYEFVKWGDGNTNMSRHVDRLEDFFVKPVFKEVKTVQNSNSFVNNKGIIVCKNLNTGDFFEYNNAKYLVVDNETLADMNPETDNFVHICTSHVTDMSSLFKNVKNFNQDIGLWDVSSVKNMNGMFRGSENLSLDIGLWDVSNVRWMNNMFQDTKNFDLEISLWEISDKTETSLMFENSSVTKN